MDEKYSSEEVGDVEGEEEPQKPLTSNKSNNSKPRVVVVLAGLYCDNYYTVLYSRNGPKCVVVVGVNEIENNRQQIVVGLSCGMM